MIAFSIFPILSRLANIDDKKISNILGKSFGIVMLLGFPMAFGGLLLGTEIIDLIFGTEYLPAGPAFQILSLTFIFHFPISILANAVFAYNRQKYLIVFSAIGALMNIVLDVA